MISLDGSPNIKLKLTKEPVAPEPLGSLTGCWRYRVQRWSNWIGEGVL
jgi:hypothetical protein